MASHTERGSGIQAILYKHQVSVFPRLFLCSSPLLLQPLTDDVGFALQDGTVCKHPSLCFFHNLFSS